MHNNTLAYILVICFLIGGYKLLSSGYPAEVEALVARTAAANENAGLRYLKNLGGNDFDIEALIEPELVTVVEFYTDACPGCKRMPEYYNILMEIRPDTAIRRVHMPNNWSSAGARSKFGLAIYSTPHVQIYDHHGQAVALDVGRDKSGLDFLIDWTNAEIDKANEKIQQRGH